jgi:hypothetical protein
MTKWTVYQLKTKEGVYVGVTSRSLKTRKSELHCHHGFEGDISAIAEFSDKPAALRLERELRPRAYMGLNVSAGGFKAGGNRPKSGAENSYARRVSIAGMEYPTLRAAAVAHGMKSTAVQYRLGSPYFPDWVYVSKSSARYWQNEFARTRLTPAISAAYHRRAL